MKCGIISCIFMLSIYVLSVPAFGQGPSAHKVSDDLQLAEHYLGKGSYQKAEELLNPIFNNNWELKRSGKLLISLYRTENRALEERAVWAALRAANPSDEKYVKGYILILMRTGDLVRAAQLIDEGNNRHNPDFTQLRQELTARQNGNLSAPKEPVEFIAASPLSDSSSNNAGIIPIKPVPAFEPLRRNPEKNAALLSTAGRPESCQIDVAKDLLLPVIANNSSELHLAERYILCGEYGRAEEILNPIFNKGVDIKNSGRLLIESYQAQNRIEEERTIWATLRAIYPAELSYTEGYIRALLKTGNLISAGILLNEQQLRQNPDFEPLRKELSLLQGKTSRVSVTPAIPAISATTPIAAQPNSPASKPTKAVELPVVKNEITPKLLTVPPAEQTLLARPTRRYERGAVTLMVNGEKRGEHFVLIDGPDILLEKSVLEDAGFVVAGKEVTVDDTVYISLASRAPGLTYNLDDRSFMLTIKAEATQFKKQELNLQGDEPKDLIKTNFSSAFINYSIDAQHDRKLDRQSVSIPHEMGVRYRNLLLFSSYNYIKPMLANENERYSRLYTNLVYDDRDRMIRYTLGDFNANSGFLGGGSPMVGASITRNFGMNPFYIRTGGLSVNGSVETNSEVEVYRNGALLTRRSISPGNFDLQNMPLMDGSGDVTLVIKDAFGREKRIDMPYTVSQELLKKGVHDFGYFGGNKRLDIGMASTSYGGGAGVLKHRVGVSDYLTLGVTGEFTEEVRNGGMSASLAVPWLGTIGTAASVSWGESQSLTGTWRGYGYRFSLFNGFPLAGFFYNVGYVRYSPGYSTMSLQPFADRSLQELNASVGVGGNNWGSISLYGSLRESSYANSDFSTIGIRYSVPIFKTANLSADLIETTGTGKTEWTSSLMFTSYLGKWGTANINLHNNGVNSVSANLQKTPENDQGLGYRLTGQYQDRVGSTTGTEVSWAGTHGVYALQYQSQQNTDIYGMKMSGSIATLFDDIYFSRPVYDSFAVIKIDSLKDVPVYNGGREVGKTNGKGKVFAPSVSSYGINPFIVKQHDLPFNYSAPTLSKSISPGWRSGTRLDFEVEKIQAVRGNISIVERGIKKPADFWVLSIIINDRTEVAPLVKDGEFYMEGIPAGTWHAEIAKDKNSCKFEINVPKTDDAMIDLGLLTCMTK